MKADFIETIAQIMLHICFLQCANADGTFGSMTIYNPISPTTFQGINWQRNVPSTEHLHSKQTIEYTDVKKGDQTIDSLSLSLLDENYASVEKIRDAHINLLNVKAIKLYKSARIKFFLSKNSWIPKKKEEIDSKLENLVSEMEEIRRHAQTLKKRADDICGPFLQNARHILPTQKEINLANDTIEQLLQRFDAETNTNDHNQTNKGLLGNHQTKYIDILTHQKRTKQTKSILDIAKFQDVYAGDHPGMLRSCGSIPLPYMNAAKLNTCKCYEKTCFSCTYEFFDELLVQESITEKAIGKIDVASTILGQVEADSSCNVGSTNLDLCTRPSDIMSTSNQQEAKQVFEAAQHPIESLPGYNACIHQQEVVSVYLKKLKNLKHYSYRISDLYEKCIKRSLAIESIEAKNFFLNLRLKINEFALDIGNIIKDLTYWKTNITHKFKCLKKIATS